LNGFISELFIYLGLFRSLDGSPGAALAAPALALVGALAVACFVKAFSAVFLGMSRSRSIRHIHESPNTMIVPMAVLAACCCVIGLFPLSIVHPLQSVIHQWTPGQPAALATLAPLTTLTTISLLAAASLLIVFFLCRQNFPRLIDRPFTTWDCGYARPTARMEYTASSFASTIVELFRSVLRPRVHQPKILAVFPSPTHFESHVDDVVLDGFATPLWRRFKSISNWLRVLQQGSVQTYVLNILIVLSFLLMLTIPLKETVRAILSGHAP
jgi:hydrogenase-4 component B